MPVTPRLLRLLMHQALPNAAGGWGAVCLRDLYAWAVCSMLLPACLGNVGSAEPVSICSTPGANEMVVLC